MLYYLQKKDLDYALVKPLVAATISTIKGFETESGIHMSSLDDVINDLRTKPFTFKQKDDEKEKFLNEVNLCFVSLLFVVLLSTIFNAITIILQYVFFVYTYTLLY